MRKKWDIIPTAWTGLEIVPENIRRGIIINIITINNINININIINIINTINKNIINSLIDARQDFTSGYKQTIGGF